MKITNSMAKAYTRCRRQAHYKYERGITPKTQGLPLFRGNWLHELLEAKYSTGNWRRRHKELSKDFLSLFEEEREIYGDQPTICRNIMESYDYHWREEDSDFTVIEVEKEFEVPLPHGHTYGFKIDALVEDEYGLWLMEHKSHKTIPDDNYRFIDIQTARYLWALDKLGYNVTGVLWNYIRTKEPSRPKLTKSGRLSRAKLDTDLFTFVTTIQEYGLDPRDHRDVILRLRKYNTFFRRVRQPRPKEVVRNLVKELIYIADEWERGFMPIRTIDRSCTYMCSFMNVCMTELYGGDSSMMVKQLFRPTTKQDYYGNPEKETTWQ